ncbi:LysM peptidoglycan-binding domain-containing protein [Candidatus Galacturonibacter soehngenii]|uniref:Peptidoglycan-binding protein n=1 Tax=Candidatus Galacturonatibacter soehngenii TaxID=2307010 RepID=A0A7V7QIQ8_9FIRM|nr:LysM peptidoglycan-binding domain-containing protein [Candidatus Galacturonibacter soehngenii]KAB1436587.1 peptidoglycan-binding protein [Candidatus Galacturonibacter soehngenii]MBA4688703.1 LysM peptidoglycan-binding domain-containing protein [Candidatus Galacturonibacter soehngenii]
MYRMYLGKLRIPVFPEKITMKINGNNKTVNLINGGEVNIIKPTGLTDIEFDILLPNQKYPFATYGNGDFRRAWYYLAKLEWRKQKKKPFPWIVYRTLPDGTKLFSSSIMVTLEEYTIKEDAKEGFDVVVSLKFKQYANYGVNKVKLVTNSDGTVSIKLQKARAILSDKKLRVPTTHKVGTNETLWSICKYYYGDALDYRTIWLANRDRLKLKSPEEIPVGVILEIPRRD